MYASKAFDRLDHKILFDKLLARNIPHCFAAILRDWYSKLTSVVRWNGVLSSSFVVTCGVRQGGILSHIVFTVYVEDFSSPDSVVDFFLPFTAVHFLLGSNGVSFKISWHVQFSPDRPEILHTPRARDAGGFF